MNFNVGVSWVELKKKNRYKNIKVDIECTLEEYDNSENFKAIHTLIREAANKIVPNCRIEGYCPSDNKEEYD